MLEDEEEHFQHFGDCFTDMFTVGNLTRDFQWGGQDLRQLATNWANANVRMLVSGVDSAAEIRHVCAEIGLSPSFVEAVLSSCDGVSERCAALSTDVEALHDTRLTGRVRDVAATLILGGKPILCPFTGTRALVRDSIDLHTFLHRHGGRACVILPDWRIGQYASDRS